MNPGLRNRRTRFLLAASSIGTVASILFMMWSLFVGTPLAVIGFMTIGQAVGTTSFLVFIATILRDLRRSKVLTDETSEASFSSPGFRPSEENEREP